MRCKATEISYEQRKAIIEWYQKKRDIGTQKSIARKMGMTMHTVNGVIHRFRNP